MRKLDAVQEIQDEQYAFPYHYIPIRSDRGASTCMRWTWGLEYLVGLDMVLHHLEQSRPGSLLDIGCGDGRFLREVRARTPNMDMMGVDYSSRAIGLAGAMNPDIAYEQADITTDNRPAQYDAATLIEVVEHIPPTALPTFIAGARRWVRDGGILIVTVPHVNYPLIDKHYQYFTSSSLREVIEPHFKVEKIVPFGRMAPMVRAAALALGIGGGRIVIDNLRLNGWVYRQYLKGCIAGQQESACTRLLAVARA